LVADPVATALGLGLTRDFLLRFALEVVFS
jgi:hypothetical protein